MKNISIFVVASLILLIAVLGCNWVKQLSSKEANVANSNHSTPANKETKEKTLEEKAIDTTVGDEKIGVPECDELFDALAKESESADEGYVAKATREYFYNKIRESIKKSIEENKNDKTKLAKECKDYKAQIDKHKAEEESKPKE
jgi:hypothetical protein